MPDPTEAVVRQWRRNDARVRRLRAAEAARPTRLGSWRVAELVAHLTATMAMVVEVCDAPAPPEARDDVRDWYANAGAFAAEIADEARRAGRGGPHRLRDAHGETMAAAVRAIGAAGPARRVAAGAGGLRLDAFCATRCVEAVVHALDLADALRRAPELDDDALDVAAGYAAAVLARASRPPYARLVVADARAHGWTIDWGPAPPVAAPPECSRVTLLELATGRTTVERAALTSSAPPVRRALTALLPIIA